MQQRKAILIAGMHRSGTSALTRVLNLLGGSLARDLMPVNEQNVTGYWECARLTVLHDQLLAGVGSRWDDWRSLPMDFCEQALETTAVAGIQKVLREEFQQCAVAVIKDPRVCRFVPLWRDILRELDFAPHVLIPLRAPVEVAQSLQKRDGFSVAKGCLLWLRNVLEAERSSRKLPRAFVWFPDLLSHWEREVKRIACDLEICWPNDTQQVAAKIDQFLRPALLHHRADTLSRQDNHAIHEWVQRTCDAIFALSQNKNVASSQQQLDQVLSALNNAETIFSDVSCDEVEAVSSGHATKIKSLERRLQMQRERAEQLEQRIQQLTLQVGLRSNQPDTPADRQHVENRRRLLASQVFDAEWYLATYSDVREAGADAATHYLKHGAVEGRNASAEFSTLVYLAENPECAATGQNPVLHFLDKTQ